MAKYLSKVKDLASTIHNFEIQQIPKEDNSWVDFLAKSLTTTPMALSRAAYFLLIKRLTIKDLP